MNTIEQTDELIVLVSNAVEEAFDIKNVPYGWTSSSLLKHRATIIVKSIEPMIRQREAAAKLDSLKQAQLNLLGMREVPLYSDEWANGVQHGLRVAIDNLTTEIKELAALDDQGEST